MFIVSTTHVTASTASSQPK